jgi:hypothetical protein
MILFIAFLSKNIINTFLYPKLNSLHNRRLKKPYKLTIYNAVGQTLYTKNNIIANSKRVDVSKYSKELLFIRIELDGKMYYHKLLKN